MNIGKIIGKNINELMNENNVSQRKLAEIINVTHPTIGKYVTGEQVIDSEKLMAVASYFKVSFDYFFMEEHKGLDLLFRADKPNDNMSATDLNEINKKFEQYIDIVDLGRMKYVPQSCTLKLDENKLNEEDEKNIEKISMEMRRIFNVQDFIPNNYFETIQKSGINVIATEFSNKAFFGASSYSPNEGSLIFINTNKDIPEERQVFTMIHELGHLLFHRNEYKEVKYNPLYKSGRTDINEKVANKFAGYFLLPECLVKEYIESKNSDVNMTEMKQYFKVSLQSLYMALYNYKLISKNQYNDFWKKLQSNHLMTVEPNPLPLLSIEEKNYRLISSMKKLYADDEITVNRISEVLELDLNKTRDIVKKWGASIDQYEKLG